MTIRYEENRIYTAECNICGCLFTVEKNSQTEMELFMKKNGWEIWKSHNVHQPNCVCCNCKSMVESQIKKIGGGGMIPDKINFEFEGENGHVLVFAPDAEGMTFRVFNKLEDTLDAIFYFKKDEWEFVNFIMNTHFKEVAE